MILTCYCIGLAPEVANVLSGDNPLQGGNKERLLPGRNMVETLSALCII